LHVLGCEEKEEKYWRLAFMEEQMPSIAVNFRVVWKGNLVPIEEFLI
jgi:hypothetical protein